MTGSSRTTARPPSRTGRGRRDAGRRRPALDWAYLERQTLGDRALQRALLSLFIENASVLLGQIETADTPQHRRDLAHTLRGAAMAVGAHWVADAAAGIENAPAPDAAAGTPADACGPLRAAVTEACAAIVAGIAG